MCDKKDEAQSKIDKLLSSLDRVAIAVEESNRLTKAAASAGELGIDPRRLATTP